MAHRVAILDGGRIAEEGDARQVIDAPHSAIGKALVAAVPALPPIT
jgi:peptide/nickel transport system ATP-binding protein